jgi:hypothetical protein
MHHYFSYLNTKWINNTTFQPTFTFNISFSIEPQHFQQLEIYNRCCNIKRSSKTAQLDLKQLAGRSLVFNKTSTQRSTTQAFIQLAETYFLSLT